MDGKLSISIGKDRHDKGWKNKQILWSNLIKKFLVTHRTAETYDEYVKHSKDKQAEIKDIGGFVGGHILNGRRKNSNILHRSIVSLDADFAGLSLWEDFRFIYSEAAAIYTTHKHCPDSPRYRLVIPLNRNVATDEYEAISRKIAGNIGIDLFDPSTFQPARLMYWPSTSKDGEFFGDHQEGNFLDADKVLSSYTDWTDVSQWPVCKREKDIIKTHIKIAGDPMLKDGLIGAFCRTYTISEAIDKFLAEVYSRGVNDERYTYIHGSTSGGLVLYENMFAFSFHGTDPAEGRLCNAFDLVRIHKFGLLDERYSADTAVSQLPSFKEMISFAGSDPDTCKTLGIERLESAASDFENINFDSATASEDEAETDWLSKLEKDKKGEIKQTIYNGVVILNNDPKLNKCFAFDEFAQRKLIISRPPWRGAKDDSKFLRDADESALRLYLEKSYGLTSRMAIADALDTFFAAKTFHPVRDYLDGLKWDGRPRLDDLFIRYLGADDSEYIRAITRKSLTAAVARIYAPGIKFDYVVTIAGLEGRGKSTLVKKLGGEWFTDNFTTVIGTIAKEQIKGRWLIEMGEMAALKRAEIVNIKQFISSQEDSYRPAYGHNVVHIKRQCIFFATTNESEFLRGADGNRRFWIVDCHDRTAPEDIFLPSSLDEFERGQVWAEAKYRFDKGEPLFLNDDLEEIARSEQKAHGEIDHERLGIITEYLDTLLPVDWHEKSIFERKAWLAEDDEIKEAGTVKRMSVCIPEIWGEALGLQSKDLNPYASRGINEIMKLIPGWELSKIKSRFKNYGVQRTFRRIEESEKNRKNKGEEARKSASAADNAR